MSDFERYKDLAERVFFHGMKASDLQQIVDYLPSKTFADFRQAISDGRLEGIGTFEHEIACMARRLQEVIVFKKPCEKQA